MIDFLPGALSRILCSEEVSAQPAQQNLRKYMSLRTHQPKKKLDMNMDIWWNHGDLFIYGYINTSYIYCSYMEYGSRYYDSQTPGSSTQPGSARPSIPQAEL